MVGRSRHVEDLVGFALSGGGSRGACQTGALKALTEAGIWPDLVAGTSAGAVNAAWFSLHPDQLARMEAIWLALRMQDVFPGNRLQLLLNFARKGYIHAAGAWESVLRRNLQDARFEDTVLPCAVVAVRLSDGARVIFDSGELVPAVMASTAIPGVFPPYRIEDELFVDGGVTEYLPLPTLVERGATTIFALDCSSYRTIPGGKGQAVDRCGRIAARASVDCMTSLARAGGRTVHLLRPDLPEYEDARDFRFTAELVAAGYDNARHYLETHALGRSVATEPPGA